MTQQTGFIECEIARQLLERLAYIKIVPQTILVSGWELDFLSEGLNRCFPQAKISHDFRDQNNAEQNSTTNAAKQFDLILVNCQFSPEEDLARTFDKLGNLLKTKGVLLFSSFGPSTLHELSFDSSWPDLQQLGNILLAGQFADPVIDTEIINIEYQKLKDLLDDLKSSGRYEITDLEFPELYQPYTATIEAIYGYAIGTEPRTRQFKDADGKVYVSADNIKCL